MHSATNKQKAVDLRRRGNSYSYISSHTGVSKSTLSDWLASIPYEPNEKTILRIGKARAASGAKKSLIKRKSFEEAKRQALEEIIGVSTRDLMMFGLGLYLGEGAKTAGIVRIVNSDPKVIQLAIAWFLSLGIQKKQFAPRIHLYPDSNVQESLQFWSGATTIPLSQFHKPHVDRRVNKKLKKHGKLPFGTLHLGVRSGGKKEHGVFFSRKIQAWNDQVLMLVQKAGLV